MKLCNLFFSSLLIPVLKFHCKYGDRKNVLFHLVDRQKISFKALKTSICILTKRITIPSFLSCTSLAFSLIIRFCCKDFRNMSYFLSQIKNQLDIKKNLTSGRMSEWHNGAHVLATC